MVAKVESKDIRYVKYAGVSEKLWYLPPKPYTPPIAITGLTATCNVYDKCGGTLLATSSPVLSTETAVFSETLDDGTQTDYSIPNTATLTIAFTQAQVSAWDKPYYDLYITAGTAITPLARGYFVEEGCAAPCC